MSEDEHEKLIELPRFSLDIRGHSEIGLVRSNNQDSAYYSPTMLVVADGMGGAAAGDLASTVAIRELRRVDERNRAKKSAILNSNADQTLPQPAVSAEERADELLEPLAGALSRANDRLAELVIADHALEGMGTTVCGAAFNGNQIGICHIGDSRGYLFRDGKLTQLTRDHSWVQSLVDQGKITAEEAAVHPYRSLLLKVLNGQPSHQPDFQIVDICPGDRLLFCSDGLAGMTTDEIIGANMAQSSLDDVVRGLVNAAHRGGGLDNITIVLAEIKEQSDQLDALEPQVIGAAAQVKIPKVETNQNWLLAAPSRDRQPAATRPDQSNLPAGVIDPDQFESIRYSPQLPPKKRRWLLVTLITLVLVAVIAGLGIWGFKAWSKTQFFIAPNESANQTTIAIYQGVPVAMSTGWFVEINQVSDARLDDLPKNVRAGVENITRRGLSEQEAELQLASLESMAQNCSSAKKKAAASGEQQGLPEECK